MNLIVISEEITGKAVVLASGGFSADREEQASLLLEFASDKVEFGMSFMLVSLGFLVSSPFQLSMTMS